MAEETRTVWVDSSERYPFFSSNRSTGLEVEVSVETFKRWADVMLDFELVQQQMEDAYVAAKARHEEVERVRLAEDEVHRAEAALERVRWEVAHRPDDPESWPFIVLDTENPRPCVGPLHVDEKAAHSERMRLHNAWPGIRFDILPYVCVHGHYHLGRTS